MYKQFEPVEPVVEPAETYDTVIYRRRLNLVRELESGRWRPCAGAYANEYGEHCVLDVGRELIIREMTGSVMKSFKKFYEAQDCDCLNLVYNNDVGVRQGKGFAPVIAYLKALWDIQ